MDWLIIAGLVVLLGCIAWLGRYEMRKHMQDMEQPQEVCSKPPEKPKRGATVIGRPCMKCGGVVRYKSNRSCVACLKNAAKRCYLAKKKTKKKSQKGAKK